MRGSLEERFWAKVQKGEGCWSWTGATTPFGHGVLGKGGRGQGNIIASRVSWEVHNGPVPEEMCVLHNCDNPPCTNPEHLFLGTKADNNKDMAAKGRHHYNRVTHCKRGHPFSPINTYIQTHGGKGYRQCRECARLSRTRWAAKAAGTTARVTTYVQELRQ